MKIKHYLAFILILILAAVIYVFVFHRHLPKKIAKKIEKPIIIKAQKPIAKKISQKITASGQVVATNNTAIAAQTGGYITGIYYHAGEQVKEGAVLFQLNDEAEIDALSAAKANNTLSQLQYKRDKDLLKQGFITQDVYHTAEVTMKQNEAQLESAKTNLELKTIKAPFSGTIGAKSMSVGNFVSPGTSLTTLTNEKNLYVSYAIPVAHLPQVALGQTVSIESQTLPKTVALGKISYLSPVINADTQTLTINAKLPPNQQSFKAGQYVQINEALPAKQKVLLLPTVSIITKSSGYYVFTAIKNHAREIQVKTGKQVGNDTVITAGLKLTDNVITEGQNQLHNGSLITFSNPKRR